MARRPARTLGVWLGDERIAELESRRWDDIRCRYAPAAIARWPGNRPLISCSLPLGTRTLPFTAFGKGLLPEGHALQSLASRAGVATIATFELLARYGRDIAGALVIAADGPRPERFAVESYTQHSLEAAVDDLSEYPLGAHDDSELSLAGLQDKLLLVDLGKAGWGRPLHGRPSTHILKLDDRRHPGLVAAEAQCLDLARAAGLTAVDFELVRIADAPCLIVSRFDRSRAGNELHRVHQEDLCQATGTDHEANRGRAKYERAGGPSLRTAAELLDTYAADPAGELDRLVAMVTFTVLIGNADAHGKNLAFLHPSPGTITLAPLYDPVPTALWPRLRTDAAMSIAGRWPLGEIGADDIVAEAASWPHPPGRVHAVVRSTVERLTAALDAGILPSDSAVADLVRARARSILG